MNKVSPIQPKLLSKINEQLVLKILQGKGPSTRTEMSKLIGMTFPTVSKAVSSLLDSKLLEEVEETSSGPGRPAKRLRLASEEAQVIGVALGGTECMVASAGLSGVINDESLFSFPTPDTYDSLLVSITRYVKKLMPAEGKPTHIVGISVPAVVDYRKQRALLSANLPLINGKSVGRDLEALLGIKCLLVRDTHALSLSERLRGDANQVSDFAMLDLCVGIGLGLMVNGRFLTGDSGYAGELGHIPIVPDGELCHCGNRGCLETVASEWALEEKVSRLLGRTVNTSEILDLAQAGDKQVQAELEKVCSYLAIGVAHVLGIINPGTFYFYGQMFQKQPQLLDLVVEKTKQFTLEPSFSTCQFVCAHGGIIDGTIACAINSFTNSLLPDLDGYVIRPPQNPQDGG